MKVKKFCKKVLQRIKKESFKKRTYHSKSFTCDIHFLSCGWWEQQYSERTQSVWSVYFRGKKTLSVG